MAHKKLKAHLAVRGGGKEHLEKHNLTNDIRSGRFTKKGASKAKIVTKRSRGSGVIYTVAKKGLFSRKEKLRQLWVTKGDSKRLSLKEIKNRGRIVSTQQFRDASTYKVRYDKLGRIAEVKKGSYKIKKGKVKKYNSK